MNFAKLFSIAVLLMGTLPEQISAQVKQAAQKRNDPTEEAQQLVQAALQAEISAPASKRQELLQQASTASDKEPSAHWQQGDVLVGKTWKSYNEVVARAKKSKQLEEYRKLRDKSEATVASQLELAMYCRKHGLKEQAVTHWSAILEFESDHEEARKALGFVRLGNQWLKPEQIEQERRTAAAVSEILRNESDQLRKMASQLSTGQTTRDEVTNYLINQADVNAIPVWELCLSSAHSVGALAVVEALTTMSEPEASLSLTRHAVWATDREVRDFACGVLQKRDPNSFMPAILNELRGPWLVAFNDGASNGLNRLVSRYALVADSKEKVLLSVLDQSFVSLGNNAIAGRSNLSLESLTSAVQQEGLRKSSNAVLQFRNAAVMAALETITGESDLETPQDWWQWWDDKNEVYATGLKPIESSYAYRNKVVANNLTLRARSSNSTRSERTSAGRKKDCLAGGTPILTERGPINIERIRMGDMVLAKHPVTGEVRLQPVLRTTIRDPEPLICITLENQSALSTSSDSTVIRSSGGHPFWVSGQGWQRARLLEPGMRLHGRTGFATVKSVEVEDKLAWSYNLVVANFHSYFAGDGEVLTHDNSIVVPVRCKVPGLME